MLWNLCNMLKCNLSKTSRFSPAEPIGWIKVGDHYVQPTSVVKELGVTLDSHHLCSPCQQHLPRSLSRSFHSIGRIRKYLSQADAERIVRASIRFIEIGLLLVIVCSTEFPLVKLRNFRDCRIPRQD